MRGVNRVMLIGNLGKDPDIQFLEGNIGVAKFSLATTETYKDRSGKLISQTEWHTIVLWRGLAELAQKYLHKGSLVYIEGRLKTIYGDALGAVTTRKLKALMEKWRDKLSDISVPEDGHLPADERDIIVITYGDSIHAAGAMPLDIIPIASLKAIAAGPVLTMRYREL